MRITKLEMHGFKSFFHQTALDFSPGISAVVGPNGCGKSNIADAIRWVMGEQSPSRLRGKAMDDVIFAGTADTRSMGYAEVNLSITRTNGPFPAPFHHYGDLTVTRRLYRSGESEYLINKVPCRLKDITGLFMDTGLGARGYSIIEQGSIGRIIDSGPEERRSWIEEAAGVVKFKSQRTVALRKLEATVHNLDRVSDILAEVDRQARSLKIQAGKARRHREFSARVKELDLALAALKYEELVRERDVRLKADRAARDRHEIIVGKETALQASLEAERLRLSEQERELADRREERVKLGSRVQGLEQRQVFLTDKTDSLTARQERDRSRQEEENRRLAELDREGDKLNQLAAELEAEYQTAQAQKEDLAARLDEATQAASEKVRAVSGLKDRLIDLASTIARAEHAQTSAEERLTGLAERRQRLDQRAETAGRERGELEAALTAGLERRDNLTGRLEELAEQRRELDFQLTEAGDDLARITANRDELQHQLRNVSGRLSGLQALEAAYEGLGKGVRQLLTDHDLADRLGGQPFLGLVAEGVKVDRRYEAATEAALAESLQGVVAQGSEAIRAALDRLAEQRHGRAGLISPDLLSPGPDPAPAPAGTSLLADLIEFQGPTGQAARAVIGQTILADDLAAAFQAWEADGRRRPVVTLAGETITPPGLIRGGAEPDEAASLLARQRAIRELEAQQADLETKRAAVEEELALTGERRAMFGEQMTDLDSQRRELESELFEAEKEASGLQIRLNELDRAEKVLATEAEAIGREKESLEAGLAEQRQAARQAEAEQAELTGRLDSAQAEAEAADAQAADLREELTGVKVGLSRLGGQRDQLRSAADRLGQDRQRTEDRLAGLERDLAGAEREKTDLAEEAAQIEEELKGLTIKVREIETLIGREQERLAAVQEDLGARAEELKAIRQSARQAEEESRRAERELSHTNFSLEHLLEETGRRHQLDLAEEYGRFIDREMDVAAAKVELDDLTVKLEKIGPVNPTAVEEYDALVERREFLDSQVEDLTASMNDLKAAIRKINKTTLERFSETFKAVAAKMEDLGPILFGQGARTQLVLTDPDDPLESGIDIKVQPPGKRLTTMGLLSGGEKALSAATLLFAIFLHKPSPFCLLDEVDAPLDEHNVERFNRLVKEIGRHSQILMITHNRRTMEAVDILYGVTMPEAGVSRMVSVSLNHDDDHSAEDEAAPIPPDAQPGPDGGNGDGAPNGLV